MRRALLVSRNTRTLTVDREHPDPAAIAEAAEVLRAGGLVAFPTETVYGLGANALDEQAVERIFAAKGRPAHDPLIVHVRDARAVDQVAAGVPERARVLMQRLWPGPLTLVLRKASVVPAAVTSGGDTVAVRCPASPVAQAVIRAAGCPLAAPSANRFAHVSPTTARHVLDDLDGRIDLVLDAGPCPIGVESTVLDLTTTVPTLLRPGGVPVEALSELLGTIERVDRTQLPSAPAAQPHRSPGLLERHYAPSVPLHLYVGPHAAQRLAADLTRRLDSGQQIGLLATDRALSEILNQVGGRDDGRICTASLGDEADLTEAARRLYAALREIEARQPDLMFAVAPGGTGLAPAVADRLHRAAERVVTT